MIRKLCERASLDSTGKSKTGRKPRQAVSDLLIFRPWKLGKIYALAMDVKRMRGSILFTSGLRLAHMITRIVLRDIQHEKSARFRQTFQRHIDLFRE